MLIAAAPLAGEKPYRGCRRAPGGGEPGHMSELELDPALLTTLQTLELHHVQFVIIGDVAEAIYNHGGFVSGLAIVPAAYGRNVERLTSALMSLKAEMGIAGVVDNRGIDYRSTDMRDLAPCSFITAEVDVDVDFEPFGTRGYQDLFDEAKRITLAPGVSPLVAAPADLDRLRRGTAPSIVAPAQAPAVLPPEPPDDGRHWHEDDFRASRGDATRT